jgi:hypothetical protein
MTHALVVGTSQYRYLPTKKLQLGQLDCAASSAYRFAKWLKESYRNDAAPLGTIRGLAAPSSLERQRFGADGFLSWPQSNGNNVQTALQEWESDCHKRPGNVAILYLCGHGIVESPDHLYVLLHDAAQHDNFDNALSVAPTQAALGVGHLAASLLFVDACQQLSPAPEWDLSGGRRLAAPRTARSESRASFPIYYASVPGGSAFGAPEKGTFFCQALIRCLDLLAVRPADDAPQSWQVTTTSLAEELRREVARLYGAQRVLPVGGMGSIPIHQPQQAPALPAKFRVRPAAHLESARGLLRNKTDGAAQVNFHLSATEFQQELSCGRYALKVSSTPPPRFEGQNYHFEHFPPAGADIDIELY